MISVGIGVLIDVHQQDFVIARYFVNTILSDQALFNQYDQILRMFCLRYAYTSPTMLALSLFNEPPDEDRYTLHWPTCQQQLYQTARAAMPSHTLMLTCAYYSAAFHMVDFDPTPYLADKNLRWDTHLYLPPLYAIQGYNQEAFPSYNEYITNLDWPPSPARQATVQANMEVAVNADATLSPSQKTEQITYSTQQIVYNYSDNRPYAPADSQWIQMNINNLLAWKAQYGVFLYCGEWGCTRTNPGTPPAVPAYVGASQANRMAYWSDIAPMIRAAQIPAAIFSLDAIDYGVTTGTVMTIGPFDQAVLDIISPGGVA